MTPGSTLWPDDRGGHLWPKDREVVAADGARIRYTVQGRDDGPWMVLCAGFLCPDNFWEHLAPPLFARYRVAILNYRGVGASTHPRDPGYRAHRVRADDYTIERFAGDVRAVLDAEDATDVTVVGHSMGCQVALEVWHQDRDVATVTATERRVAALALVTGPYASPLHTFYGSKLGAYLFPLVDLGLPLLPRPVQRTIAGITRLPFAMWLARLIKALGPHTPEAGMQGFFEHFARADPMVTVKIAKGMHRFDAGPWLAEVDAPTLIVVGAEDKFSPPELGEVIEQEIEDAELVRIEGGTHGALLEFPEEIAGALLSFLERRLGHADPAMGAARGSDQ